ncbi:PA2169 family four-helix-bundle protein [Desertivirga arenae]|uniref:PA2169 family four-helix-bundle protein n=1 Tax=Desertivirga arenae TaxID=2810309 RepID=UPI001A95A0A8|nr:PA2169 family four-helix-bundle protein [Pedobacter sp. SYSU D00823]
MKTTTYPENHTRQLQRLLGLVSDSRKHFQEAIEKVKDTNFKNFLNQLLIEREALQIELKNRIIRLGGNPDANNVGFLSNLERSWQIIKAKASGSGDQEIIESCRNAEQIVLDGYDDVLQGTILEDEELKYFITSQRFTINQSFLELDQMYFNMFKTDNTIDGL